MPSMHDLADRNRRNTWLLIFVFVVVLVGLGLAIGLGVGHGNPRVGIVGVLIAGAVATFMVLISYSSGDAILLTMSRAREVHHNDAPQLFNVVEEMAIAAGVPMPKVYIIDEDSPNAFATGRDPEHASVAITRGLLTKLDRDELQGVMAHEMSHVRNFDIRFALFMAVLVGSVALLSDFFLRSLWFRGGRKRSGSGGGGADLVFLLIAIVAAILAPIVAKIIQLAVSRQREYLADASAVELTRYPEGLARALEKLQNDREPLQAVNRATQHLYIVNPVNKLRHRTGNSMWSTHPPVAERIRRLREMT